KARSGGNLPVRLKGRICLNILNDDALPPLHRTATSGPGLAHAPEVLQKILLKAALPDDLQRLRLRVVELNITEVGVLQFQGGTEDFLQLRLDFSARQEADAEPVEAGHGVQFGG